MTLTFNTHLLTVSGIYWLLRFLLKISTVSHFPIEKPKLFDLAIKLAKVTPGSSFEQTIINALFI